MRQTRPAPSPTVNGDDDDDGSGGLLKTLMGRSVFNKTVAIPIMHFEDVYIHFSFFGW